MNITLTREEAQQVLDALMHQMWSRRPLDATEEAIKTLRARLALHDMNKESERIGEEL
jgi:glycine cleavage system aminomethyltransferase T